jgi:hypothetical protein
LSTIGFGQEGREPSLKLREGEDPVLLHGRLEDRDRPGGVPLLDASEPQPPQGDGSRERIGSDGEALLARLDFRLGLPERRLDDARGAQRGGLELPVGARLADGPSAPLGRERDVSSPSCARLRPMTQ